MKEINIVNLQDELNNDLRDDKLSNELIADLYNLLPIQIHDVCIELSDNLNLTINK